MNRPYVALVLAALLLCAGIASAQMVWNRAAHFDGASSVVIAPSPELDITGTFTIEAMVRLTDSVVYDGFYTLVNKRLGSNDEGFSLYLSRGKVAIRTNNTTRLVGHTVLPFNTWVHIAGVYSAGYDGFNIYFNGLPDTSVTITNAAPASSADSLRIGKGFNTPFIGDLDNVRIWNTVRTGNQIRAYQHSQLATEGGVYTGLVLSLPFQLPYYSADPFSVIDRSFYRNGGLNRGATAVDFGYGPYSSEETSRCLHLFGTDDYLAGADAGAVSPTSAMTMEAWVRPDSAATQVILTKGSAYRLLLNAVGSVCSLRAGINGHYIFAAEAVPIDQWTHVAFTYTTAGEEYAFYVNGEAAGSGTLSGAGTIPDTGDSLLVGGGKALLDFKGYLDEIRISDYAKTQEQVQSYLYRSIDNSNEPNEAAHNVVYNFDGTTLDNASDGGPYLWFCGDARFTWPIYSGEPEAPLVRAEELNFPGGYYLHKLNRFIPDGTSMKADSIWVSEDVIVDDMNVFVAINHTDETDLTIRLMPPFGGSPILYNGMQLDGYAENVITIFDNQADSTQRPFSSFTPRIRPVHSLKFPVGSRSQGWWKILVDDNTANGETGRLYAWGIQFNDEPVAGVVEEAVVPETFALRQNYPNPFNPSTRVSFDLPKSTHVTVSVYNVIGQEVSRLVDEQRDAGRHEVVFDARGLASGVYFCTMRAGDFVATKKLMLLR